MIEETMQHRRPNISRTLSLRRKLVFFMVGITGSALLLFSVVSVVNQARIIRQSLVDNVDTLASVLAGLSGPPLSLPTQDSVPEILKILRTDRDVEKGVMFAADGRTIAAYTNLAVTTLMDDLPDPSIAVRKSGHEFFLQGGILRLKIFHPVILDGKQIGTLYLRLNLANFTRQLSHSIVLLLFSLMLILLLVLFVSSRLQRLITGPLSALAETARKITESGDYEIRVERTTDDEIGTVIDDFNTMLDVIKSRDAELLEHRHHLERIVEKRTEELCQKRDEALAAARAKSEFLANMSHEIRTPMNGIIGVLSLLKGAHLNEEYKRLLQTATRSADSLLLIINDILDFSKIEAGKIDFESIDFDLRDLMEEVTLLFVEAANLKHLNLLCFVPTDVDSRVQGDPTRLRQILTNLLSNAIKFTGKGEVILQVALIRKQHGQQLLRFSVEDTGIGIAADALKNLFQKFTQADGSTTRKYGGTGLGLSVCKQLVELQNGEIGVDSEEGKGSIFWFTLTMQILAGEIKEIPVDIVRGRRFLIVDDNPTNRLIIEHYLESCHAETFICDAGDQAVAIIRKMAMEGRPVHTVLLDYHMPSKDGLQLAAEITQEFGQDSPELILLSSESGVRKKAARAGIRTIIYKPIRLSQFYNALSSISRLAHETVYNEEKQDTITDPRGRILLVDDEPINQKVGVAILKKFGIDSAVANNGREAVRMNEESHYDLILMDIQMPEMSGFEATEEIRKRERLNGLSRIPIIAMTANAMESTREHCLAIGMDDFIAKPIKPDTMMERLQPWLRRFAVISGREETAVPSLEQSSGESGLLEKKTTPSSAKIWDRDQALQLLGGDETLLRELAGLFLQRNALLLENVDKAIRAKDAAALHEAAHAYKGAVNHFSAAGIKDIVFTLEKKGSAGDLSGTDSLFVQLNDGVNLLLKELQAYVV
jgi:two-component system, sensor histidine kinase and response regulator